MIEVLILSLVQGITEFLPISSSSHIVIFSEYLAFQEKSLSIDISLHIGSFIAVIIYFKKEIFNFIENKELFFKIFLSSIPIIIIGFILVKTNFIDEMRNIKVIAWMTLIFGFFLYFSDKFKLNKNLKEDFNLKAVLIIGICQAISLVPGVSRSGITITAARLLNFNRFDSAKISFLLSIPTLLVVTLYGVYQIFNSENNVISSLNLLCILLSFFFSYITIKFFLKFIKKFNLTIFVIYRIILGITLLYISYL